MSEKTHLDLLGKTARDRVTGFSGVVASISFDLYGCVQAVLTPPIDKDGKPVQGCWFDVNRLDVTKHERVMPVPDFTMKVEFGATPQEHKHGPAEKPVRSES